MRDFWRCLGRMVIDSGFSDEIMNREDPWDERRYMQPVSLDLHGIFENKNFLMSRFETGEIDRICEKSKDELVAVRNRAIAFLENHYNSAIATGGGPDDTSTESSTSDGPTSNDSNSFNGFINDLCGDHPSFLIAVGCCITDEDQYNGMIQSQSCDPFHVNQTKRELCLNLLEAIRPEMRALQDAAWSPPCLTGRAFTGEYMHRPLPKTFLDHIKFNLATINYSLSRFLRDRNSQQNQEQDD